MAVIKPYHGPKVGVRGVPNGFGKRQRSYSSPVRGRSLSARSNASSPMSISSLISPLVTGAATAAGGPVGGLLAEGLMTLLSSRPQETQTDTYRKRYGAGRWAGYVKRRKIKRKTKNRIRKKVNNSYQLSVEKSGTQTPSVCAVLGHSSISRGFAVRAVFGALLRMILYRAGVRATSPTSNITPMVTGTKIGVQFQYAGATNDGWDITITAPISFSAVLDAFINSFNTKYDSLSATLAPYDIRLRNIYMESPALANAPQTISIDLMNAKVSLWTSSRLKIQNRSLNTPGDDDANDVDNVPINVVSYQGYGTGLDSRYDFLGLGLCANQDCIIATSDPPLAGDAPLPALLQGVKKSGFTRIQPGGIKTDVVKAKIYVSLDTMTRHILGPRGNGNLRLPLGKFSFMHYEKTMEANNASPVSMNIAYENQLYINSKIILRANDLPIPEFYRS